MLALEEKVRTVVLLRPEIVLDGKEAEILAKFEENYLEVKAKKQVYLTQADAESFFHYLPPAERKTTIDAVTRGLSQVVALEHLDGEVIEKAIVLVEELSATYGLNSIYCSQSKWETMRDLEFFFPHLDASPVERTLALIKADGLSRGKVDGKSLEEIVEAEAAAVGLFVVGKRQTVLPKAEAEVLCEDLKGSEDHQGTLGVLVAEPGVIAMCLEGKGAIGKWLLLCGPTNSGNARDRAPNTIRARWGTDGTSNAVHASESFAAAEKELKTVFPQGTLQLQRTLCIVKPDALANLLQIRMEIEAAGFTVLKDKQLTLSEARANEFYRDHKDKPYFAALVQEACAGPCCVMVLCRLEAVAVWKQMMGPEAVKEAKQNRPGSIRARFGQDGQRNAVHGSDSAKSAALEVRFFFSELGADPVPDDDEVRDFLFRKTALASMDLKNLDAETTDFSVDPTLQQLLSSGLMALCHVQPKGLGAVKWLSRWLAENNPNAKAAADSAKFAPPERTKRFVEYGVGQDGLPYSTEVPPPAKKKQIVDVDVSEEVDEGRISDLTTPPFVVFMAGGPGSGKGTQCTKLKDEFNMVHLSTGDLMREEVAAGTYLGTEIDKHLRAGTLVPDSISLQLLKKTMVKYQDTNRFLLDGFPRSVEQAKRFEQEIGEMAFMVYFESSQDTMKERIKGRAAAAPGRSDDDPATVEKRLKVFTDQTVPVVNYYAPIGKVRTVNAEKSPEEVYAETKKYFSCRFLYLSGPPGAPAASVAERLEQKYGYSAINLTTLLRAYANSGEKDASIVKQSMAKGKPIEASIVCPLILSEIYRDMALGVQNFVICDFPQSLKQVEFLEYRIPCKSKPLLLDFTRTDAEDLAALVIGGDSLEAEMQTNAFFGKETKEMLKSLPGLVRIPCSLAGLDAANGNGGDWQQQLVESTWSRVCEKTMPGLTIVLGLPCSGTNVLAPLLASKTPNTQAVDCNQLLEKELERSTEVGITMHNMLARGQVVPLSVTLQLLKDIVNLTSSDNLVIENCPMYADQIEYLSKEFRIDRVFYIAGNDRAVSAWRESFVKASKSDDPGKDAQAFDERVERLEPIVQHFSKLGKLERFDVTKTPDAEKLGSLIEKATMPQFAVVLGQSVKVTPEQAAVLATATGCSSAVTPATIVEWALRQQQRTVDPSKPEELFAGFQKYADACGSSMLVLDRYPATEAGASQFLAQFGDPKVVVNLTFDDEELKTEYMEVHAEDETPPEEEAVVELLANQKAAHEATLKAFSDKCPSNVLTLPVRIVEGVTVPTKADLGELIKARLLPRAYVVVAPAGIGDFSGLVANAICTFREEGGTKGGKFTSINSTKLFDRGGHRADIEEKLLKASFRGAAPDCVNGKLWAELFGEALSGAANPMGNFLVTNFPTPFASESSPTIRDQFCMLGSIASLAGIIHVSLSENAFSECVAESKEELEAYQSLLTKVSDQTGQQFSPNQVCDVRIEDCRNALDAANQVAAQFLAFQEKVES